MMRDKFNIYVLIVVLALISGVVFLDMGCKKTQAQKGREDSGSFRTLTREKVTFSTFITVIQDKETGREYMIATCTGGGLAMIPRRGQ